MFRFFKRYRRKKLLAQPFPADWKSVLHKDVALYRTLDRPEKTKLHDDLRIFIDEHHWESARDFELTEEMKVIIAAQACLLTLGHEDDHCLRVRGILVLPSSYEVQNHRMGDSPVVSESFRASGHTSMHGPVVLSWMDVYRDSRNERDGRNVVLHEFAHRLDMCDGLADGMPPARNRQQYLRWQQTMVDAFEKLQFNTDMGLSTVIRSYGATNPTEFFAVVTEAFFEKPTRLQNEEPDLYGVLREFYRQDPARRGY